MNTKQWVEYYLEHPDALEAFIDTANEQANEMANKLNKNKHNVAWKIYEALKNAGAEIGNASVNIIENALDND